MDFESFKERVLSDPKVKAQHDKLKPEFDIAREMIGLRRKLNLSQQDLAARASIKQPQIARIETGKQSPRITTLAAIASSVGYSVEIKFVPNPLVNDKLQK